MLPWQNYNLLARRLLGEPVFRVSRRHWQPMFIIFAARGVWFIKGVKDYIGEERSSNLNVLGDMADQL